MTSPAAPEGSATPLMQPPARPPARPTLLEWLRQEWQLARRPRIECGWASLCGARHANNQDAVIAKAPLFAVADGVGGGSAGELASSQLLAWCREIPRGVWRRPDTLVARLRQADSALAQALQKLSPGGRSATTFAGAWLGNDGRGCIAHVGDSRILHLRPQAGAWQCTALTVDHTYANLGEQPPPGGDPDDPARMLGVGAAGEPEVAALRLRENEWLLLCSDGLHRFVPMPLLASVCRQAGGSSLHRLAQDLAQLALARGSQDDISVLLVRRNPLAGARAVFWVGGAFVAVAALVGAVALGMADGTAKGGSSAHVGAGRDAVQGAAAAPSANSAASPSAHATEPAAAPAPSGLAADAAASTATSAAASAAAPLLPPRGNRPAPSVAPAPRR